MTRNGPDDMPVATPPFQTCFIPVRSRRYGQPAAGRHPPALPARPHGYGPVWGRTTIGHCVGLGRCVFQVSIIDWRAPCSSAWAKRPLRTGMVNPVRGEPLATHPMHRRKSVGDHLVLHSGPVVGHLARQVSPGTEHRRRAMPARSNTPSHGRPLINGLSYSRASAGCGCSRW